MKFYNLENAPLTREDKVYKQSPFSILVPTIICAAVSVLLFLCARKVILISTDPPVLIFYFVGAFAGLFALVFFAQLRSAMHATNWLLRANPTGVLIKYRSYLNRKLPATDTQVVGIDYSEIAWARQATEQRTVLASDRGASRRAENLGYLEISLINGTAELAENLNAEATRECTAKSHWEDSPVFLLPDGTIRVHWRGDNSVRIVPRLKNVLKELGRHIELRDAATATSDFASFSNLSEVELKAKVLHLIATNDKIAAYKLARLARRCSLSEAMQYVEKLKAENP